MNRIKLSGLLAIFYIFTVAQAPSVVLDKINTSEMTGSYITALNSDFKGYLWIGTPNGLNRFDGYSFRPYRSINKEIKTLSSPNIRTIKQFDQDELLIGTANGLNAYSFEENNFTRILIDETTANSQKKNNIYCLGQLKSGEIIVGTGNGLFTYNKTNHSLEPYLSKGKQLLDTITIQSTCIDKDGNLWLGTKFVSDYLVKFRVYKYTIKSGDLKEFNVYDNGTSGHLGISEDYLGNIWVSADDGLVSIHPKTFETKYYKSPEGSRSCVSYFHSKDQLIYQGYWSYGVSIFDIEKKEFRVIKNEPDNSRSLISNKVWSIFKDENDVVWYGTDIGLQKQSNKRQNIEIIKRNAELMDETFVSNQFLAVHPSQQWKNKIFASIDGNGFAIYDKISKKTENFYSGQRERNQVEDRFISQFYETDSGEVFSAGQYNFIKIYRDKGKTKLKHYFYAQQNHFTCVFPDYTDKNILWIGSIGQIIKFNIQNETFEFFKKPAGLTGVFWSGLSNSKGTFFVTNGALLEINDGNIFKQIKLIEAGNINCIEGYDGSNVLIGTSYLGLIKFNINTNTYDVIKNVNSEYFSEINSLKRVRNSIWIGTNVGLYQFFPLSNEMLEYNVADGLPSSVIKQIDYYNNKLYISTNNGLVVLNPNKFISSFKIPKIDLTSIIGIGNDLEIVTNLNGKEIKIPQGKNSFKLNFTVLDFNLPSKNTYKYKLLPLQNEWKNIINDHSISFNELNVGEYEFQVIGANSDNIWNSDPVTVKITIVPPFYNSNTFYIILFLISLTIVVLFIYYRNRRIKNTRIYLEKTIKDRTEEINIKQKLLATKNAEMLDSITYAQKIQKAFLVGETILSEILVDSFIYFKPKEKVSGDFFWIGKQKNYLIIAAADCTGHGVPGAILSVIGTTFLNKIIHEEKIYTPGKILTELNYLFYNQLNVDDHSLRDGMDISIITIDLQNQKIFYAGARNNAVIIENNKLTESIAQRESIGENKNVTYETKELDYNKNATYYIFSDGYKDQFGGPQSKKLASKAFKDILLKGSKLKMNGQKNYFGRFINDWQGNNSQTDDRIIIGFKLP